jgi:hypothetical protein
MSLVAPLWLLAGTVALLVVLLHAVRHNRVEVPSLILWRRLGATAPASSGLRPPRWSVLLLLQLLAVLMLALALAQPLLGANTERTLHDIYVLDASAGMRGADVAPSRFDAARAELIAALPGPTGRNRVSVAVPGGDPSLLFARQEDGTALAPTIRTLTAGDGTADWPELARTLAGIIRAGEDSRVTVWTNGQGDPAAAILGALPDVPVEVRTIGNPQSANAGITEATTAIGDTTGRWRVTARVALKSVTPSPEIALQFQPFGGGSFLDWGRIVPQLAAGGQSATIDEEIELPSDGTLLLSLPPDLQPADDSFAVFARTAARPIRALYVGEGNRPLQLALLARGDLDLFRASTLPADADAYDLIIAENVVLPRRPATNLLWLGSARLEGDVEPIAVVARPTGWDSDHPLSEALRWSAMDAVTAVTTPAPRGAIAVLSAAEGPLIVARTTPTGREVRLGLDLDPSGWAGTPDFPIFISNLVDWIAADPAAICTEGERCIVPARLIGQPVVDENGTVIAAAAPATGEWVLDEANSFVPRRAGVYTIGRGAARATRIVNAATPAPIVAAPPAPPQSPAQRPIAAMPWLVLIAAALLVVEAVLAGRGKEGFLRRNAMASDVPGARMRRWSLGLRALTLALVVMAVIAVPLPTLRQSEDTVLIIEPQAGGDARRADLVAEAEKQACDSPLPPSLGLVGLSAVPFVASDLSCGDEAMGAASGAAPGADVGKAVELAAAMIRPGAKGRIVIASDGGDTGAGLDVVLASLRARGLAIDVLPLTDRRADDTIVAGVESPGRPVAGETLPIRVRIDSPSGGSARLRITSDGKVVDEIDVVLKPGSNVVDASLPQAAAGDHVIEASLVGAPDTVPLNDRSALAVAVAERPMVAVVTPQLEWGETFARALALQGIDARVMLPRDAPVDLKGWLGYAVVALMNVPAIDLGSARQNQLEHYVRVNGRGLLLLGGENSFGPGGYYATPLEAMSPLSARVPKDLPAAAMGFVLDRSGSMKADVGGVTRLDIAKSATLNAVEVLDEKNQVSIVVFDTKATLLVPMQDRKDVAAVEQALMRVAPGGGTSIAPGLSKMLEEMRTSNSRVRHIVVMSDGQSQGGDLIALTRNARSRGMTISAVAIGSEADVATLQTLARDGGGAFYFTEDFRSLPSILSQEALMLSGESMEAGGRPVTWVERNLPFLEGLPDSMPEIDSYVLTTAKPEARLHLATTDADGDTVPLLASWQYGNGTVLALATHAVGPGSVHWMALAEYPVLWSQIVRNILPTTSGPGMSVTIERTAGQGAITAEVLSEDGEPVEGLTPMATITRDGEPLGGEVRLQMVAPGRYTASFEAATPGTYVAEVAADGYAATSSLSVAYPSQFDFTQAQPERLEVLAAATGGRVITGPGPLATSRLGWHVQPVWRPWIVVALLALLADLAVRYVPGRFPFLRDQAPRPRSRPQRAAA